MDKVKHSFLLHTSAPPKGSEKEYYERVLNKSIELIDVLNQPIFLDRFHIGESVYGEMFRGYNLNLTPLDEEMNKRQAKTIFVTASLDVLAQRYRERGDWHVEEKDLEVIVDIYKKRLNDSILPLYILDTSNNISEEDIEKLIEFIYS